MLIKLSLQNLARVARDTDGARGQALRACTFPLAGRLTPFVGVEHNGVRYVVSTRESAGVGFWTFEKGVFDAETVRRVVRALAEHTDISTLKGLTVLEVGANIGTETVSMLVSHGVERIVAFEPGAENVRFLRANLALNGVQERVQVHQMALSDSDGMMTLECSEDNWGDHRIRTEDASGPELYNEGQRVTVQTPARRLDSLVDSGELDLEEVDLVWIDAQGHEGHILAGAKRLLTARIPVLTEYWPYGLRRAGGLDRFHELVAERYDLVVDLRAHQDSSAVVLDAARVTELAARYASGDEDPLAPRTTDLLLLPR